MGLVYMYHSVLQIMEKIMNKKERILELEKQVAVLSDFRKYINFKEKNGDSIIIKPTASTSMYISDTFYEIKAHLDYAFDNKVVRLTTPELFSFYLNDCHFPTITYKIDKINDYEFLLVDFIDPSSNYIFINPCVNKTYIIKRERLELIEIDRIFYTDCLENYKRK